MERGETGTNYADAPAGGWQHANKVQALLRVTVGLLFVGHGGQKLFGWFGGSGIDGFAASLAKLGVEPPLFWAYFEASAELIGGVLLVLGLLTPLAAAAIAGDMLFATLAVHADKGLWSQDGGFEYNLVLIVLLVAVGVMGAGRYSLDQQLGISLPRPHTFVAAILVALALVAYLLL